MNTCWGDILGIKSDYWEERYRWEINQDHLVFKSDQDPQTTYWRFHDICEQLQKKSVYLVTIVANDERHLEDECFKLYYVFSHDVEDHFLILEYPLRKYILPGYMLPEDPLSKYLFSGRSYPSIRKVFTAAISFEREILDLFDLTAIVVESSNDSLTETISLAEPLSEPASGGFLLHDPYPPHLAPLEMGKRAKEIQAEIARYKAPVRDGSREKAAELVFPVGPIHAGIIEAGHFDFYIASEVVDDVQIQLGYKHKGIEKLFQTKFSLLDGWQLAEKVSGDSSFSHSLAYCHAVEALTRIEPPPKAIQLRGLFLELERLYNHIADSAALARDVAFDLIYSEISVIREFLVRLNAELTGHRLLRGVNRPGGIVLPPDRITLSNSPAIDEIVRKISRKRFGKLSELMEEFRELGELLLRTPAFRDRAFNTGNLKKRRALEIGATGLIARASGLGQRDFRVNHPFGVYQAEPSFQRMIDLRTQGQQQGAKQGAINRAPTGLRMSGDVFSRLEMRLHEVNTSFNVISELLQTMEISPSDVLVEPSIEEAIRRAENFEFALGYVEGWRGDIVYWVMKDRFNRIFRCKVRDPSFLNWPALRLAVIPDDPDQPDTTGNILPDFPVINKSFNLSYAGHDL